MKILALIFLTIAAAFNSCGDLPESGTYNYTLVFNEWRNESLGTTVEVIIKGNKIKVLHNGSGNLTGRKGDLLEEGILMKHKPTGRWIIGQSRADAHATEVGGCSGGPTFIDPEKKIFEYC